MRTLFSGLLAGLVLASSVAAWSCACFEQHPHGDGMTEPELKAFIYHQGDLEHLITSVQFSGAASKFAWIIPVESRPEVGVVQGPLFNELDNLEQFNYHRPQPPVSLPPSLGPPVAVVERKTVGPFDVAVLKAADSGGLHQWLQTNGFNISQRGSAQLEYYVRKNWYFVAARISPDDQKSSEIASQLKQGTIAPLDMSFHTHTLSYPMRSTGATPGQSQMELYVAEDHITVPAGFNDATYQLKPMGTDSFGVQGTMQGGSRGLSVAPTLRGLLPRGGTIHYLTASLSASQRDHDLVFSDLRVGQR